MTTGAVLLCGDVHGDQAEVGYAVGRAVQEGCDRAFFLGDFGYWEHEPQGVAFLDAVQRHAHAEGISVYFLDGNHDNVALLLRTYHERDDEGFVVVRDDVRYAPRGHRWTWGGLRMMAFGGAVSLDKEPRLQAERARAHRAGAPLYEYAETLWFSGEEATAEQVEQASRGGPVDVLLTHDKPRASRPAINRKDEPEAYPNQDRVQAVMQAVRPDLLVHGHLHYRYTDDVLAGDHVTRVEGLACDRRAAWGMPGYRHEDLHLRLDLGGLVVAAG